MENIETKNNSGMNLYLAAGLGLVCGAIVALLVAPAEGKETREKVGEWFGQQKKNLSHKTEQVSAAIDAGKKAYAESQQKKELVNR